ncbi:MAG: hypothetical protein HN472_07645 [Nitrospina sp.]|jgi:hypothetical protein|nr:hypothetical protein [Nitrospina sp.]MBT5637978.1 hypothetical protein [Candidatus Peribacter sp.]
MHDQIKQAIARSISHNEIVHLTINGNIDDALTVIESLIDSDTTETDHVWDNSGVTRFIDVWAAEIDAPDGEMIWRLGIS